VRSTTPGDCELERRLVARERGEAYDVRMVDGTAPEYTDRDVRLRLLDEWGIDAAVLFPSSGLAFDAPVGGARTLPPEAVSAAARAFNRWIEEDWGFAYQNKLFAAPFISLQVIDEAVAEFERVMALGARIVQIRLGPVNGRSPAHPDFDPFWARVHEAQVPVALHITTNGYERLLSTFWGEDPDYDHTNQSAFQWYACFATRPATDTIAALIFHNLFGRFPDLKVLSVENGSRWVRPLLDELDAAYRFVAGSPSATWLGGPIHDRPSEIFRRSFYVAPFLDSGHEAPLDDLVGLLGAEHVLFGSDWPHGEGRDTPRHFDAELGVVRPADLDRVLRTNTAGLLKI
jgi:predicted TIM-barrel fold metal-dependent hydrolase